MKPILFNGEMVRAILEGRKTQTRRVIKNIPHDYDYWGIEKNDHVFGKHEELHPHLVRCRYQPGDILWVRETWRETGVLSEPYSYRADALEGLMLVGEDGKTLQLDYKWRPSIHLPREAARIFLKATDVRVERLQEITANNVLSEGVLVTEYLQMEYWRLRGMFAELWDSINGKKYPWASNPWVWVYEFERTEERG